MVTARADARPVRYATGGMATRVTARDGGLRMMFDASALTNAAPATAEAGLERAQSAAQRIAARFFKVERDQAIVRGVKAVVWPDSGLGCSPVGGRKPVATPGYLAMVEVAGQVYAVHMTANGRGLVCLQPAQN